MTAAGTRALDPSVDKRTVSVLLIEDNELDAMLVESAMQTASELENGRYRYDWTLAKTLAEARAALASRRFDLAIVDLALPDSDGLDTLASVRGAASDSALLVLTARDDHATAAAALRLGALEYVVKGDLTFVSLERALRYALERKELADQHARDTAEREHLEEQLRHSQRMESLGRLAGGVAHDFNNVLTVILGHAGMLREEIVTGEDAKESIREIQRAGETAARLTGQLLAFSRHQPSSPRILNLNDAIADLESMLSRLVGENVELALQVASEVPNIRIDPGHVEQIVMNLAVNARDAMPDGGVLAVHTAAVDVSEEMLRERPYVKPGTYVHLSVADTGVGMDEAVRTRAFEPFFTTKEKGRGTGLGLSTVYGIVKQAQGYIWCRSEPGRGTRFDIFFPATNAPLLDDVVPTHGHVARSERILVVDDDAAVRSVVMHTLRAAGYKADDAGTGSEAIRVVETSSERFDLLLTDMVMPGMTGREVARRVVARLPNVHVIYMSGYTDDEVIQRGDLPGNHYFLQKPFSRDDLLAAVARAVATR